MERPEGQDALEAADPWASLADRFPAGTDLSDEVLALLGTPTIADKSWVWRQYDHQLFLNTVAGPGGDATVLRLRDPESGRDTGKGLALTTDGKARFCRLSPRSGGRLVVLEAARNLACVGATPKALVNCLNFGNPEHPEVMWQFAEVVEGMSQACEALDLPVIGGNVSFYNESLGRDIDPTPVVGVLGLVDELTTPPPGVFAAGGDRLVVLGDTAAELGGSEWAAVVHGLDGGPAPAGDLQAGLRLHDVVRTLVVDRIVGGVHDCSDGGLAVVLAEMAIAAETGMRIEIEPVPGAADLAPAATLFSESANRVVVAVGESRLAEVLAAADAGRVPAAEIGVVGGDRFVVDGCVDLPMTTVASAWRDAIPSLMEATPVQV